MGWQTCHYNCMINKSQFQENTIRLLEASNTCCSLLWITLIWVGINKWSPFWYNCWSDFEGDHYEREHASGNPLLHFPASAHIESYSIYNKMHQACSFCHLNGSSCGTTHTYKLINRTNPLLLSHILLTIFWWVPLAYCNYFCANTCMLKFWINEALLCLQPQRKGKQ